MALLLLVLVGVEALSYVCLHLLEGIRPGFVIELYLDKLYRERVKLEGLRTYARYDAECGWSNPPDMRYTSMNVAGVEWTFTTDGRGARGGESTEGTVLVTTYGDSFTASVEVEDDQTWQTYLSRELGGAVLNFGVPAYGTFQAVLLMERHLEQGLVAPVTVLAVWEGDLKRVVNRYRPYVEPSTFEWPHFKPALRAEAGRVRFYPNLWQSQEISVEEHAMLARQAIEGDFWADRWARLSFPYTYQLWRMAAKRIFVRSIWKSPEGRLVFDHVVDRFVAATRAAGSQPVLLFIPATRPIKTRTDPTYTRFEEATRRRYPELIVIDVADEEIIGEKFHILPFEGHASAYGNQIIAGALAKHLKGRQEIRTALARTTTYATP